jgi:hypothetical protein
LAAFGKLDLTSYSSIFPMVDTMKKAPFFACAAVATPVAPLFPETIAVYWPGENALTYAAFDGHPPSLDYGGEARPPLPGPLGLNGSCEQARALIPLKLALHELHPDQGRRSQRLGFAREFGQTLVKRMVVYAFHTGIHNSQLTRAGG